MGQRSVQVLREALSDPLVLGRYEAFLRTFPGSDCVYWAGAVAGRGHGRFWLADGVCVIAHRFGFGVVHGFDALMNAPELGHGCDNPLCQSADHLDVLGGGVNRQEWAVRRHRLGGPLRDRRGARLRAVQIRDALRNGDDVAAAEAAGIRQLDRLQIALF